MGFAPRALSLCSKSDRFLIMELISSYFFLRLAEQNFWM